MEALLLKRDAEHVRFFAFLKIDECVAQLFDYFFLNRKCYQKKLVA
jgi:hypothetical protein